MFYFLFYFNYNVSPSTLDDCKLINLMVCMLMGITGQNLRGGACPKSAQNGQEIAQLYWVSVCLAINLARCRDGWLNQYFKY